MSAVPDNIPPKEQIEKLRQEILLCEKQMLRSYKEGYKAGISRGEKLDQKEDAFREAMFEISQVISQNGYFLADESPSQKGLDTPDIVAIHFIVNRCFGIDGI